MSSNTRVAELLSKVVDGAISDDDLIELRELAQADQAVRVQLVDHLLLDTLLSENLGQESLTALVDLVGESSDSSGDPTESPGRTPGQTDSAMTTGKRRWPGTSGWLAFAASLLIALTFFVLQTSREAYASAVDVVQAAMQTLAAPIERVYVVEVKRGEASKPKFEIPRDVRVATQGDRFWVQVRGYRDWAWGRDEQGALWMTLGQRRAVVVNPEEMGSPLRIIGDLFTLNLETLLQNFLKHCRLEMSEGPGGSMLITAIPRRQWSNRPLRRATLEVDRETKAIRKLVIEREFERSSSIVTFTLVDSRLADESLYGPAGHLSEPYRIFSAETDATRRRELITNWFGPMSEQWLQVKETQSNE